MTRKFVTFAMRGLLVATFVSTPLLSTAQEAQEPAVQRAQPTEGIEEIVVTARKREESLQTVPLSISSLTGKDFEQSTIRYPSDLARFVPSLEIAPQNQATSSVAV